MMFGGKCCGVTDTDARSANGLTANGILLIRDTWNCITPSTM